MSEGRYSLYTIADTHGCVYFLKMSADKGYVLNHEGDFVVQISPLKHELKELVQVEFPSKTKFMMVGNG